MTKTPTARGYNKLSALKAERLKEPGRHSDGRNLYLVIDASGAKRWAFIYRWKEPGQAGAGRLREMGLGSFDRVSLQSAREKAAAARTLLGEGKDPITAKRACIMTPTFAQLCDQWIEERQSSVRSHKSVQRWQRALHTYAAKLGPLPIDQIGVEEVLSVLKPMWLAKAHSAKLLRGYIESVLDVAKVRAFRSGENPARWKGQATAQHRPFGLFKDVSAGKASAYRVDEHVAEEPDHDLQQIVPLPAEVGHSPARDLKVPYAG